MMLSLQHSLLELGNSTSENLGFAQRPDVFVSYGEETITETNLLELRRRHPKIISLRTFCKKKETANGSDWEWHIIGRRWTLKMRVQAKRVQKDGKLKIPHVTASGDQQIDVLIADAKLNKLRPIYCIYSSEKQRLHWKKPVLPNNWQGFETGCLLTSAHTVKVKMPKSLVDIEKDSVPWHYLVARATFAKKHVFDFDSPPAGSTLAFLATDVFSEVGLEEAVKHAGAQWLPTVDQLNNDENIDDLEGIFRTDRRDSGEGPDSGHFRERGISKLIAVDVREAPDRRP